MKKVLGVLVIALTLIGLLPSSAPAELPQPWPTAWPMNRQNVIIWHAGSKTCTYVAQWGQYGSAAYLQLQVVDAYSNSDTCTVTGRLIYDAGQGTKSAPTLVDWKGSGTIGWVSRVVNPAFFFYVYLSFEVVDGSQIYYSPEQLWGHYACPNGC